MRTLIFLTVAALAVSFSSCKKKQDKKLELTPKTEILDTMKPEPAVIQVSEELNVVTNPQNYFVVAGCFREKDNADRLNSLLISQRYNSRIIPYYSLHMVTYGGYETHREAQKALNSLVMEPGKSMAWIYPVK